MRLFTLIIVCCCSMLVVAGCHDEEKLRQRLDGPPVRLPAAPNQPKTLPAPALLDTVKPWQSRKTFPASTRATWSLVELEASPDLVVTYRVPSHWHTSLRPGRSANTARSIMARSVVTKLDEEEISLASYAAQLADGAAIYQYTTTDGHVVYVTRREVALAPSDPEAPREIFHTAVVSVDGHIIKLDVRYASTLDWRFDELADAITGTLEVRSKL